MTLTGIAHHAAITAASCWLCAPLSAHVVDLGTIDRPLEYLSDVSTPPSGGNPQTETAKRAAGSTALPWDKRTIYTFADVMPGIDGTLALEGTVRSLYHDVLRMAGAPKTERWLAFLVVVCLIAVQLRRTQRLLHHRTMAR